MLLSILFLDVILYKQKGGNIKFKLLPLPSKRPLVSAAPLCSTQTIAEVKSIIRYHRTVIRIVMMMGVKMILSNERLKISRLVLSFSCWLRFICLIEIGANESYATRYNMILFRYRRSFAFTICRLRCSLLYFSNLRFQFSSHHNHNIHKCMKIYQYYTYADDDERTR